jgi:hypothetical protein
MVASILADFCEAAPFRPFQLFVSDGRSWLINHPDFVSLNFADDALIVYGEEADLADLIDLQAVVSLRYRWDE